MGREKRLVVDGLLFICFGGPLRLTSSVRRRQLARPFRHQALLPPCIISPDPHPFRTLQYDHFAIKHYCFRAEGGGPCLPFTQAAADQFREKLTNWWVGGCGVSGGGLCRTQAAANQREADQLVGGWVGVCVGLWLGCAGCAGRRGHAQSRPDSQHSHTRNPPLACSFGTLIDQGFKTIMVTPHVDNSVDTHQWRNKARAAWAHAGAVSKQP